MNSSNGNGAARPVVRGVSLVHRSKLTKSQRAVIVANVDDGIIDYRLTQTELAKNLNVSLPMVQQAKRLSPLARQRVMSGSVTLGYYARHARALPRPAPVIATSMNDDETLLAIIHRCGVNHVVDIAAAVEAAQ